MDLPCRWPTSKHLGRSLLVFQAIGMELNQNWSSQDMNQQSYRMLAWQALALAIMPQADPSKCQ